MSERPAIVQIRESTADDGAQVTITLSYHDEEFSGAAHGSNTMTARPRLVGEATLRAVEEVTENRIRLDLDAIATTSLGGHQVAMAQVRIDGDDLAFVGSALIMDADPSAATVRAVLDALNRRLESLL